MAIIKRPQVVFNQVSTQTSTSDWSHETVLITWTATMRDGSILDAANAEIAVSVSVAVRGCVFNSAELVYTDGAAVPANLTGLAANLNTFK